MESYSKALTPSWKQFIFLINDVNKHIIVVESQYVVEPTNQNHITYLVGLFIIDK